MAKHAYLIIANEDFDQVALLLEALDYPQNDLYLHIDAKVKEYDVEQLNCAVRYGTLTILDNPVAIIWGSYSQIEAELRLLERATQADHYERYHLLSGKDMPLKTQKEIHAFFGDHADAEFVRIGEHGSKNFEFRYKYYFKWLPKVDNPKSKFTKVKMLVSILGQRICRVDRTKVNSGKIFKKGTNWFSITDSLARYVLECREWIESTFQDSYCCDEVFLQTIIYNSDFVNKLYYAKKEDLCSSNMRMIDWTRGRPYVFRSKDKAELIASPNLFVRKVDKKVDAELVAFLHKNAIG